MASTYTIGEALTLVSKQISRNIEDNFGAYIATQAQNKIWNKYDWRETIAQLPPFYLIPNEQEYGPPSAIIPTNFSGLRETYIVNIQSFPARRGEIKVRRDVRLTNVQALPTEIGYEPSTKRFRVFPRVPNGIGASAWLIDGTYKIKPAKITADVLSTAPIIWDDMHFHVFVGALKWAAWDAAGDQRAGQISEQNGAAVYTGQLGIMHELIDEMAAVEGLNLGDPAIAPSEPLVYPTNYGGGLLFPGMGF